MKKLLTVIMLSGILTNARSQVYVQGGVNLANITTTKSGKTQDNNLLTTFNAGILGRFNISTPIDLESGLLIEGRGAKSNSYFTGATDDNYVKTRFNPLYLEVPLNLVLRIPLEKTTHVFFNAGPYAAMGIGGKSKTDSKLLGVTSSSSDHIKFSNDDPSTSQQDDAAYNKLKRFDFGLNFGAGLDLGKILLKFNYGLGLAKINSTQSDNGADRSGGFDPAALVRTTGDAMLTIKKFFDTPDDVIAFNSLSKSSCVVRHYVYDSGKTYEFRITFNNLITDDAAPQVKADSVNYATLKYHINYDDDDAQAWSVTVINNLSAV